MNWTFTIIIAISLIVLPVILYLNNVKIRKYVQEKYPELILTVFIGIWAVFIGALFALEFTKQLNEVDNKKNYLSMLNSCKNMNERYVKNFTIISKNLDSGLVNFDEMNRLIKNMDKPFLLEEIVMNSDLYKCASIDFRNWLPDIISYINGTNWAINKDNIEPFLYNKQFLLFLREILTNEENYINNDLSERRLSELNDETRLRYNISTNDIPISDIIMEIQKSEVTDSANSYIEKILNK